jgi:hypothetical protein
MGTREEVPVAEFVKSYIWLAKYEMNRPGGDLRAAEEYIGKIMATNGEVRVSFLSSLFLVKADSSPDKGKGRGESVVEAAADNASVNTDEMLDACSCAINDAMWRPTP